MLPPTIPIFPLPNVVLFPNVFLPLHIFEPRYRQMVGDALGSDRLIGMSLLRPGFEASYEGRPAVYPVGCAGVITHSEQLADGRYNIVLRGLERFRIEGEDASRTYRLAHVTPLPETLSPDESRELAQQRRRLEAVLAVAIERSGAQPRFPPAIADEDLVNALSQYLELDAIEKQALLERSGAVARCVALIELLEMKTLTPRGQGPAVH
jgi:Lon protease-like protein